MAAYTRESSELVQKLATAELGKLQHLHIRVERFHSWLILKQDATLARLVGDTSFLADLGKANVNLLQQLAGLDDSHLELPLATLVILGQLQQALGWGIECLSRAGEHRYADEPTCSRWLQHAGAVIQTSGLLPALTEACTAYTATLKAATATPAAEPAADILQQEQLSHRMLTLWHCCALYFSACGRPFHPMFAPVILPAVQLANAVLSRVVADRDGSSSSSSNPAAGQGKHLTSDRWAAVFRVARRCVLVVVQQSRFARLEAADGTAAEMQVQQQAAQALMASKELTTLLVLLLGLHTRQLHKLKDGRSPAASLEAAAASPPAAAAAGATSRQQRHQQQRQQQLLVPALHRQLLEAFGMHEQQIVGTALDVTVASFPAEKSAVGAVCALQLCLDGVPLQACTSGHSGADPSSSRSSRNTVPAGSSGSNSNAAWPKELLQPTLLALIELQALSADNHNSVMLSTVLLADLSKFELPAAAADAVVLPMLQLLGPVVMYCLQKQQQQQQQQQQALVLHYGIQAARQQVEEFQVAEEFLKLLHTTVMSYGGAAGLMRSTLQQQPPLWSALDAPLRVHGRLLQLQQEAEQQPLQLDDTQQEQEQQNVSAQELVSLTGQVTEALPEQLPLRSVLSLLLGLCKVARVIAPLDLYTAVVLPGYVLLAVTPHLPLPDGSSSGNSSGGSSSSSVQLLLVCAVAARSLHCNGWSLEQAAAAAAGSSSSSSASGPHAFHTLQDTMRLMQAVHGPHHVYHRAVTSLTHHLGSAAVLGADAAGQKQLKQLRQQNQLVLQGLDAAMQGNSLSAELQQWAQQLQQFAATAAAAVPLASACNNPCCIELGGVSEGRLVKGRRCSRCKAGYCSDACQEAHWKAHKSACKRLAAAGQRAWG